MPMPPAITNDLPIWRSNDSFPAKPVAPEASPVMNPRASTMMSTSVRADSRKTTVLGIVSILSVRMSGTTTADDVPPKIVPTKRAVGKLIGNSCSAMSASNSAVTANVPILIVSVLPAAESRCLTLRWMPPSNRMMISARFENTLPTRPKSCGPTTCKTGPIRMPASIKIRTSGTFVRSKKPAKKWPKKTRRPTARMVIAMETN